MSLQPKVAIIAGTRLIFHFLAVYLLLCFPLLCRTVAQNLVVITLVGWFHWLVLLVVITLDGEQLEAVVNMSSPPLLMGEM